MTKRHMPVAALTAAALSLIVINSPAFAQGAAEPQAAQPQQNVTAPISDQKIEAFAVAYLQVDKVRQNYAAKIGSEQDATNKQKLQNEANQQMINAVETSPDMSLDEYKTIITAAQTNPEVAKKVQDKLKATATTAQ